MKFTAKQYAQALHQAIFESAVEDQEKILNNFAAVLKENGDLVRVDEIENEFLSYEREQKGVKLAEVTTARKLTEREEHALVKDLNEYVKGQVELRTAVDQGLVGGAVVRIGDELIDGSVRKNLKDLKEQLAK